MGPHMSPRDAGPFSFCSLKVSNLSTIKKKNLLPLGFKELADGVFRGRKSHVLKMI